MTQHVSAVRIEPSAPSLGRFRKWLVNAPRGHFWIYFSAATLFGFGLSVYYFLFNIYLVGFGLTERTLGIIGSLSAVGGILGTIPAGMVAERFGLRLTLTCGLLLALVSLALRACIIWLPAQFVLAVLIGLTLSVLGVTMSPMIAGLTTQQQRPFAFGIMFAWGVCTNGLGGFVASRLPALLRTLPLQVSLSSIAANRYTLLFGCGVAVLALLPLSRLRLPLSTVSPRARLSRPTSPFLLRFLLAMAVWNLVTGSFAPFANVYFVHHLGLPLERAGSIFTFSQGVCFVALLCAPLLFRRTGLASGIMLTQLATAASLAGLACIHTATQAAWMFWAYMAFQSMNEPGIYSLLMERSPERERNSASAFTFFVSAAAQAIASLAVGAAIVRFGYSAMISVIAALAVVAAMLFRRLPDTPQQASPPLTGIA
jgi:MFS family permease